MRCMQYAFSVLIGFPIFLFSYNAFYSTIFFHQMCFSPLHCLFSSVRLTNAAGAFAAWIHHMWNSFNDQRPTTPIKPHVLSLNSRHPPTRPPTMPWTSHHLHMYRPLNIIIEAIHNYIFRVLHDTVFHDIRNEALLRLDVFVELW